MSGPTEHVKSALVGGTSERVRRSRCVVLTSDFTVLEFSAAGSTSFAAAGIAAPWTQRAPGTPFDVSMEAGRSGDVIAYYGNGATALGECGATVAAGQYVTAGTDARLVPAISFGYGTGLSFCQVIGKAQEGGAAGDVIRVEVNIFGT